jgi:hypothetical protein
MKYRVFTRRAIALRSSRAANCKDGAVVGGRPVIEEDGELVLHALQQSLD